MIIIVVQDPPPQEGSSLEPDHMMGIPLSRDHMMGGGGVLSLNTESENTWVSVGSAIWA